ncbi:MAG: PIN domain-containing protein [Acinetobacter sp.]|nr:PIN domain-containing protein [Acinetobacter sp.]
MNDKVFLDTNILIYSVDKRFPDKQNQAMRIIAFLQANHRAVISTQVLQEFYNATTKKLKLDKHQMQILVDKFAKLPVLNNDVKLLKNAIHISIIHHLTLWDAYMVAGAKRADCTILYTEDLTHNQIIEGVKIINPFYLEND